ncbi:hypothetical protein O181_020471 [Austropuccinia psidii MF-1]|uniref:Uncharacterized protein n=1 Tax=Austropuccinia psidii MF-1 TaxID=1389203 RepID=A0A9Q3CDI9_9BASI|nr:hypothetical protein [Austropuccinia psidii MF-1]
MLYTYKNSFYSDNEPLGSIGVHEVDTNINIDRPYPPLLGSLAYPESLRARKSLEKHLQELIQLGVRRNIGHNEEAEVTNPVIISWHNDK